MMLGSAITLEPLSAGSGFDVPVAPPLLFPDCAATTSSTKTITSALLPLRKPTIAGLGIFPIRRWYVLLLYSIEDRADVA
jgi:hypothetical protein